MTCSGDRGCTASRTRPHSGSAQARRHGHVALDAQVALRVEEVGAVAEGPRVGGDVVEHGHPLAPVQVAPVVASAAAAEHDRAAGRHRRPGWEAEAGRAAGAGAQVGVPQPPARQRHGAVAAVEHLGPLAVEVRGVVPVGVVLRAHLQPGGLVGARAARRRVPEADPPCPRRLGELVVLAVVGPLGAVGQPERQSAGDDPAADIDPAAAHPGPHRPAQPVPRGRARALGRQAHPPVGRAHEAVDDRGGLDAVAGAPAPGRVVAVARELHRVDAREADVPGAAPQSDADRVAVGDLRDAHVGDVAARARRDGRAPPRGRARRGGERDGGQAGEDERERDVEPAVHRDRVATPPAGSCPHGRTDRVGLRALGVPWADAVRPRARRPRPGDRRRGRRVARGAHALGRDLARPTTATRRGRTGRSRSSSSSGSDLKRSAGILPFRTGATGPEVLVVHPGGPFWARRDEGAWSIPKGEVEPGEEPQAARCASSRRSSGASWIGPLLDLGSVRQRSGKVVQAWAAEADFDPATLRSAEVLLEWPPRSGHRRRSRRSTAPSGSGPTSPGSKLLPAQAPFVDRLLERLAGRGPRARARARRAGPRAGRARGGRRSSRRRRGRLARAPGPGRPRRPRRRAGSGAGRPNIACPTRVAWACSARSASRRVSRQPAASRRAPCHSSQRQRRKGRRPGASSWNA